MKELLGESATCEVKARDQYGRAVARCFPGIRTEGDLAEAEAESGDSGGKGGDAGLSLVESGDAFAYRKFSKGFYEPAEKKARENREGIWSGEFDVRFFLFFSSLPFGFFEVESRCDEKKQIADSSSRSLF